MKGLNARPIETKTPPPVTLEKPKETNGGNGKQRLKKNGEVAKTPGPKPGSRRINKNVGRRAADTLNIDIAEFCVENIETFELIWTQKNESLCRKKAELGEMEKDFELFESQMVIIRKMKAVLDKEKLKK